MSQNIVNDHTKIDININDFIPSKYNRNEINDNVIKYLTYIILAADGLIFFGSIQSTSFVLNDIFPVVNFIFIIIFFIMDVAWLHYKLQHIIVGSYKLFMDLKHFRTNSKYYSGVEIPDKFLLNKPFPCITIQLPVYKEDLENTLKPTIMSAIEQAERYIKETGSVCNIIVCDDGYNLIPPEDKEKRLQFYTEYNIGFTARPPASKLKRNGRFKKAGNLNFSLNFSENLKKTHDDEEVKEMTKLGAVFYGNLKYGAYVFLIDSDTRFPHFNETQNGCLKRIVKDMMFDGENTILYIQCFTGPYMSTRCIAEKCVFHFTCHIYNGILVGTSLHSMSPLVGHNAMLNLKLLEEIAPIDPITKYKYYWDENRISEDFDCMMRGCNKGYIGRYMSCAGVFLEGVSFNYMTEYFKVSKFACGAAEMTFNPVSKWFTKWSDGGGFFSPDIIGFIKCEEIEWYNKLYILSYILNFIAIAQAHFAAFYNLIFFDKLFGILPFALLPTNLMWEGMIVWGAMNTTISVLFAKRLQFDMYAFIKQQSREIFFTSSLYGSLSARFSIMYFTHLFNLNMSFGATQKDDEKVRLIDWISSTRYEFILYTFYTITIFIRLYFFPYVSLFVTAYYGCLPMGLIIFWYWVGPLAYDILPTKKDKITNNTNYIHSDKMFNDIYKTQILNSPVFCKK